MPSSIFPPPIPPDQKDNKIFVLNIVREDGIQLKFASNRLKDDIEVVTAATINKPSAVSFASERLKNDKDFALFTVKIEGNALQHFSKNIKNDFDVVKVAVQNYYGALAYASGSLKNDPEIVKLAIMENGFALFCASQQLKTDKSMVLLAISEKPDIIKNLEPFLKNNNQLMLDAVKVDGSVIRHMSEDFLFDSKNKNIVIAAINQNNDSFGLLPTQCKANLEFALEAVKINPFNLKNVSEKLKNNYLLVDTATTENAYALKFASEKMKLNPEFLIKFFAYNPYLLESEILPSISFNNDSIVKMEKLLKKQSQEFFIVALKSLDEVFKPLDESMNRPIKWILDGFNDDKLGSALDATYNDFLKNKIKKEIENRKILSIDGVENKVVKKKSRKLNF